MGWMVLGLLAAIPGQGSERVAISRDFQVRQWTTSEGLPDMMATSLAQTADGYLWIGSRVGLTRFDGQRFVTFHRGNSPGLVEARVARIGTTGNSDLWVLFASCRVSWGRDGWFQEVVRETDDYVCDVLWDLGSNGKGSLWMKQRDQRWSRYEQGAEVAALTPPIDWDFCGVSAAEEGGWWWAAAEGVVWTPSGPSKDIRVFERPYPTSNPLRVRAAFAHRSDGSHWLLRDDDVSGLPPDLVRLTMDGPQPDPRPGEPRGVPAVFLVADRANQLWYPTPYSGLRRLSADGEEILYANPVPWAGGYPTDALVDHRGALWMTSSRAGLLCLTPHRLRTLGMEAGLPHANVRCVHVAGDGSLWVGSDNGAARLREGSGTTSAPSFDVPKDLESHSIRAFADGGAEGPGTLTVGTLRGLYQGGMEEGFRSVTLPVIENVHDGERLGSRKVRDLLRTRAGDLWIATAHSLCVQPRGQEAVRVVAGFEKLGPMAVFEDREGTLWITTEGYGLWAFSPASRVTDAVRHLPVETHVSRSENRLFQWYLAPTWNWSTREGLPSDHVWDVTQTGDGSLWLSSESGLHRLPADEVRRLADGRHPAVTPPRLGSLRTFTSMEGLPDHEINSLVEDGLGNLWLGINQGLVRVPMQDFKDLAEGRRSQLRVVHYTASDGLVKPETHGRISHPGAVRTLGGQLAVATAGGVVLVDPEALLQPARPPRIALEEVRMNGRPVMATSPGVMPLGAAGLESVMGKEAGPLRLAPGEGRVAEFRFTSPDLTATEHARFRVQLVGHDRYPEDIGDRRAAYYTNLDPGDYRFRVWAGDEHDQWSEHPAEYAFVLEAFLWEQPWFWVVVSGSILGLATVIVRGRLKAVRTVERLQRRAEQAELRTRMARDLHDGVGSGLAQLTLLAGLLERHLETPDAASQTLQKMVRTTRDVSRTVRDLIWNAQPLDASLEGLLSQITEHARDVLETAGIRLRLDLPMDVPRRALTADQRSSLFFAAREVVANIVRHARAKEARLKVHLDEDRLRMEWADDGVGLPRGMGESVPSGGEGVGAEPRTHGNGMINLRARLQALGGTLRIESEPNQGTRVCMDIPMETFTALES